MVAYLHVELRPFRHFDKALGEALGVWPPDLLLHHLHEQHPPDTLLTLQHGAATEARRGKWSTTIVGALSERPPAEVEGRSESAPTGGTRPESAPTGGTRPESAPT